MRRACRVLGVAGTATVLVLAAVAVGVSLAHAGYDAQSNRAPAARIVLAGIAVVPAAGGLRAAGAARSGPGSRGLIAVGLGVAGGGVRAGLADRHAVQRPAVTSDW